MFKLKGEVDRNMKESKNEYKYHSLSVPVPIIEKVKKFIQDKPEYSSVAEFAKFAMKDKMQHEKLIDGILAIMES